MYELLLLYKYWQQYQSSYCSLLIPILVKITTSVADILADPIIGTPLFNSPLVFSLDNKEVLKRNLCKLVGFLLRSAGHIWQVSH